MVKHLRGLIGQGALSRRRSRAAPLLRAARCVETLLGRAMASTIYTAAPGGGGGGLEMGLVAPGQQPAPFVQSGGCDPPPRVSICLRLTDSCRTS